MKNKIIAIVLFISLFLVSEKVNAGLCTSGAYNKLKKEAYNVKFSYEMQRDTNGQVYFTVTVMNFTENVILIQGDSVYEFKNTGDTFNLTQTFKGGETIKFSLYGGYDTDCVEEYLYSKSLKIPKYNTYSELDECFEYEEFELCNKWYQGNIPSEAYFMQKLEEYKESIKPVEEEKKVEEEKSLFEQVINFYVDNIIFTLPLTILVIGIIIFIIVRKEIRKKNRVKLDFDFKV